jgi:carbon-monoxide dehydrogenase medium subunit
MKPASALYLRPRDVEEAVALLARHADGGRVLAGGQSLVPMMNLRRVRPTALVDVSALGELDYVRPENGHLAIGALTRTRSVERDGAVAERLPLLREAAARVGHPAVRNRGTLGGNLANADPLADLPPVMVALDAELVARGSEGERVIAARDFFLGAGRTALKAGELLTEVRVPALPAGAGSAFLEVSRRGRGWGVAAVAAVVVLADDGTVLDARLALGCAGPAPIRALGAEAALRGQRPGPEAYGAAAQAARAEVTAPPSDVHGSAEYRRHLAGVLTTRALAAAVARAEGIR